MKLRTYSTLALVALLLATSTSGIFARTLGPLNETAPVSRVRAKAFCASESSELTAYRRHNIECSFEFDRNNVVVEQYTHMDIVRAGY